MKCDRLLVVVDPHQEYLKHQSWISAAIDREMKDAEDNDGSALVLEMVECELPSRGGRPPWRFPGPLIPQVELRLQLNPSFFNRREKRARNGAPKVREYCDSRQIVPGIFRLCGGFLDGCLLTTALGILCDFQGCTVEIVGPASFANRPSAWMELLGMVAATKVATICSLPSVLPILQRLHQHLCGLVSLEVVQSLRDQLRFHPDSPLHLA